MDEFIRRQNIAHFIFKLSVTTGDVKRAMLLKLLAGAGKTNVSERLARRNGRADDVASRVEG